MEIHTPPEKEINKNRHILWAVSALIIAALTITAVFARSKTMTLSELREMLRGANPIWILMSFVSMLGFIYFEGLALITLLKATDSISSHKHGFVYGAADAYFSAITPSATGGQPAVVYFMIKYGVPVAVAAASVVLNLTFYNSAIVALGVFAAITHPEVFLNFNLLSQILIVLGSIIMITIAILLILLLKRGRLVARFMNSIVEFLARHHILKNSAKWLSRIENLEKEYEDAGSLISGKPSVIVKACIFNLLQVLSQLMVTVFMDLAIYGSTGKPFIVWATQCYVTLGAHCIPIPGAMGASDYLMIDGFRELMSESRVFRLELLSRGMAFYFCVIFACIVVLISYLKLRRDAKR